MKVLLAHQTTHQLLQTQLNNSTMVMLNGKTYAPSSYVGSPRFTRMEKTARTTFSDGERYPTTKEVRLLLMLCLVGVVVTGYRSLIPLCSVQRTRRKTSGTSWKRGCRWTTWPITGALLLSIKTNWIVMPMTCLLTTPPCIILSMLGCTIWMPPTSLGTLLCVPCAMLPV